MYLNYGLGEWHQYAQFEWKPHVFDRFAHNVSNV